MIESLKAAKTGLDVVRVKTWVRCGYDMFQEVERNKMRLD